MRTATDFPEPCAVCRERDAEIVDGEQGAICFECHDELAAVDGALGACSLLICPPQSLSNLPEQQTTNPTHNDQ